MTTRTFTSSQSRPRSQSWTTRTMKPSAANGFRVRAIHGAYFFLVCQTMFLGTHIQFWVEDVLVFKFGYDRDTPGVVLVEGLGQSSRHIGLLGSEVGCCSSRRRGDEELFTSLYRALQTLKAQQGRKNVTFETSLRDMRSEDTWQAQRTKRRVRKR